ncbi:MAG: hypothetical protein WED15_05860 [Akkermansiaceae bacterium]
MKRHFQTDKQTRFVGKVRHYHRSGGSPKRSWDEWVDGTIHKRRDLKSWLMIVATTAGFLLLASIIVGLTMELM